MTSRAGEEDARILPLNFDRDMFSKFVQRWSRDGSMLQPDSEPESGAPPINCVLIDEGAKTATALRRIGDDAELRSWVQWLACHLQSVDDTVVIAELLARLPNLEMLEVDGSLLFDAASVGHLGGLIGLAMPGSALRPADCQRMVESMGLHVLRVWDAHDDLVRAMAQMRSLRAVGIAGEDYSEAALVSLASSANLRNLSVELHPGLRPDLLLDLVAVPNVHRFFLSGEFPGHVLAQTKAKLGAPCVSCGNADAAGLIPAFISSSAIQ